ncbi:unnamed protein product [Candidula unifasciata]|uniref:Uncharacterized protein n=1 Tax=Candidula unifasciata TaxID=100452 RepID=A0A8S3YL17_9EUPU|nr:unnamed protein product [Candidula unifasciata]
MQCYTRAHRYPRTTSMYDYRAPPLSAYKKRQFFRPEPDKIGRPWCPDGVKMPAPWEHIKRIQYNPVNELHREKHMDEMIPFMNKTNWTCGQDMQNFGSRKTKVADSKKYSLQSSYRAHYPGYWLGIEPRRNPGRFARPGIVPELLSVRPYVKPECHPLIVKPNVPWELPVDDPNVSCGRVTVPHYILEPYPGPQVPVHLRKEPPKVETVDRMGLVE